MVIAIIWAVVDGGLVFEWQAIVFGIVQGIVYQTMWIALFSMLALGGLSISFTINRLAIAIPIAGGIFLWGETPSTLRIAGIILSFLALPLIGSDAQRVARQTSRSKLLMPFLTVYAVLALGFSGLAARAFVETRVSSNAGDVTAFLFIAATTCSIITWPFVRRLVSKESIHQRQNNRAVNAHTWHIALLVGAALGILNFIQSISFTNTLLRFPSSFVFPFTASVALLVLSAIDYLVWKQRFGRLTIIGLVLSAITVILINF